MKNLKNKFVAAVKAVKESKAFVYAKWVLFFAALIWIPQLVVPLGLVCLFFDKPKFVGVAGAASKFIRFFGLNKFVATKGEDTPEEEE